MDRNASFSCYVPVSVYKHVMMEVEMKGRTSITPSLAVWVDAPWQQAKQRGVKHKQNTQEFQADLSETYFWVCRSFKLAGAANLRPPTKCMKRQHFDKILKCMCLI